MPPRPKALRVADDGPDIREMLADWQLYIGQMSADTIKIYMRSGRKLADWLEAKDCPTGVAGIGHHTLQEFFNELASVKKEDGRTPRYAEATRSQIYRSLQQFFRWLAEVEEEIPTSPMGKVRAPSQKPVPVPILATDDLRKLVATVEKGNGFEDRRDHAILRLLIDTGLRIGELATLTVDSFERERGLITVTGKSGTRHLRLERKTAAALVRYLRVRGKHRFADRPELWLAVKGTKGGAMTHWGIRQVVDRRVEEAGLTGRIYPHKFRHTYAHRWLANGGQEEELIYNAGWTSNAMLARYGRSAAAERARAAVDRVGLADQI